VASVSLADNICINDVASKTFGEPIPLGGCPIAVASASADPKLFATVTAQGSLVLTRDGNNTSTELGFDPTCVAFSHDDARVAIGGKDKKVRVYSVAGDEVKEIQVLENHRRYVTGVAFSVNGLVATCGADKTVFIYDAEGNKINKGNWEYHSATIRSIEFSPDGNNLLTSSSSGFMFVWKDMANFSPERFKHPHQHPTGVLRAKWLSNNQIATLGALDSGIKTFTLPAQY